VVHAIDGIAATERSKMMKTKIVTVLSLAGVLIAGSAAAMVNTQVLGGSASPTPVLAESAPQETTPASVATNPPVVAVAPVAESAPPAAAPASTQAVYAIGDSGTVTLDTAGDRLSIIDVTPAAGWTVTESEINDGLNAEIKFQSGSIEVEFHANLLFGVVTTSVESKDESAPNGSVVTSNSVSGQYAGGDDDGEEHDGGGDDD
jgi:hypothetical protein